MGKRIQVVLAGLERILAIMKTYSRDPCHWIVRVRNTREGVICMDDAPEWLVNVFALESFWLKPYKNLSQQESLAVYCVICDCRLDDLPTPVSNVRLERWVEFAHLKRRMHRVQAVCAPRNGGVKIHE